MKVIYLHINTHVNITKKREFWLVFIWWYSAVKWASCFEFIFPYEGRNCGISKVIVSPLKGDCSLVLVFWLKHSHNIHTPLSHPPAMLTNWISFSLDLCFKTSNYFLTPEEAKRNESDLHKSWNLTLYDIPPTKGTPAWSTAIYQAFIC